MGAKKIKRVEIQWVDDDFLPSAPPENTAAAKIMNRSRKVHVQGIPPWTFEEYLKDGNLSIPDLFLVDFKLNEYWAQDDGKYPFTGEGLVGKILDRYKHQEIPVYLVSKVLDKETAQGDDEIFELKLPRKSLTQELAIESLILDALDYRAIRTVSNRHSVESIHSMLKTPDCSREQLEEALPVEFRKGLGNPWGQGKKSLPSPSHGSAILFSRWVRRSFLRHPGLLYDDLYTATYLGMTEGAFVKRFTAASQRKAQFSSATYSGIFARPTNRRWWKYALADIVYELAAKKNLPLTNVWEMATEVFHTKKSERSLCAECGKEYPETVAHDPDDYTVRKPVHRHCSKLEQNHNPPLNFEQRRILLS